MDEPKPTPTAAKSVRLPVPLWQRIRAYQLDRMLSTEAAAHRELLEAGLRTKMEGYSR